MARTKRPKLINGNQVWEKYRIQTPAFQRLLKNAKIKPQLAQRKKRYHYRKSEVLPVLREYLVELLSTYQLQCDDIQNRIEELDIEMEAARAAVGSEARGTLR
jgi:hypothetical protein